MINYSKKSIVLPSMPVEPIESICLFLSFVKERSCESDNQEYVLLMASDVELEQMLDEIPVVREYPSVFPDDIPKFPPKENRVSIELVLGSRPISIAP